MDGLKSDSETELTSTMGNALSVTNKDEKNDTNDATPTSSTDASTASTASRIVSDDPISSTSCDTIDQTKASEMSQSVTDLLEMNIPSEKITEDVEDLVHDLESLLGESTDSFSIPLRTPTEELKEAEDVVSQTSGEPNEEQDTAVTCEEEIHSEETTLTLETSSTCIASAQDVSETFGSGGSGTKIETDITSSETSHVVDEIDAEDVVVNDQPETTVSDEVSALEQESQPEGVQAVQVSEKDTDDSKDELSSRVCDNTDNSVKNSGDKIEDTKIETENVAAEADLAAEKGDQVVDSQTSHVQETEYGKNLSSQTSSKNGEETINEEKNTTLVDNRVEDQNVISTPELKKAVEPQQESGNVEGEGNPQFGNSTSKENFGDPCEEVKDDEQPVTSEVVVVELQDQKTILEDSSQTEAQSSVEISTTESTVADISEVTMPENPEGIVSGIPITPESENPETREICNEAVKNEEIGGDGGFLNPNCTETAKVDNLDENMSVSAMETDVEDNMSTNPNLSETVDNLESEAAGRSEDVTTPVENMCETDNQTANSEVTVSGIIGISETREICNESVKNEEIGEDHELYNPNCSESAKVDNLDENMSVSAMETDVEDNMSTNPNLSETVDNLELEAAGCSVDVTTLVENKCDDQTAKSESTTSSLTEITVLVHKEIANDMTENAPLLTEEEASNKTEVECGRGEEVNADENKHSTCSELESKETKDIPISVTSEEITDTGENDTTDDNTQLKDIQECGGEGPLVGITTNISKIEENTEDERQPEGMVVEDSSTAGASNISEKCFDEPQLQYEKTDTLLSQSEPDIAPTTSDSLEFDISQDDIRQEHQTDDVIQAEENIEDEKTSKENVEDNMIAVEIIKQKSESDLGQIQVISNEANINIDVKVLDQRKVEKNLSVKHGEETKVIEELVDHQEISDTTTDNNEIEMKVVEDTVNFQEVSDTTEVLDIEKSLDDKLPKTDNISQEKLDMEGVECSQSNDTVLEKQINDPEQLAESSGIVEELESNEKLDDKNEQMEQAPNGESTSFPNKTGSSEVESGSCMDVNEVEVIKESEVQENFEPKVTEAVISGEDTEEFLTQPDSTQTIEKTIDTYEKADLEVSKELSVNEIVVEETSEVSANNLFNTNVQKTLEIPVDEIVPLEVVNPSKDLIDSCEDNPNTIEAGSRPAKMSQLEFAPLELSEEDSEEETVSTLALPINENSVPEEDIDQNVDESDELPHIEEILADQPVFVESTTPAVDMQENLETMLAVASLQKIDIPKDNEPERSFSEKEKKEMEALRRAVESITDDSVGAYVEEVEELINISLEESNICDTNISLEQPELMEVQDMEEAISRTKMDPTVVAVDQNLASTEKIDIVQDTESTLTTDEGQNKLEDTEVPDSSKARFETTEVVGKIEDPVIQEDTNTATDGDASKTQELETLDEKGASISQVAEQSNTDLKTLKESLVLTDQQDQSILARDEVEISTTSAQIEEPSDVGNSKSQSELILEKKETELVDNIEEISSGLGGDELSVPQEDKFEGNRNIEESNKEVCQNVNQQECIRIEESQEIEPSQKSEEECDKTDCVIAPLWEGSSHEANEDKESPETKDPETKEFKDIQSSLKVNEVECNNTEHAVRNSQELEVTQKDDEEESNDTDTAAIEELQESEVTQNVDEEEISETIPEVVELLDREAIQKVDKSKTLQRRTSSRHSLPEQETLIDSSQVITESETPTSATAKEKEVKPKANERSKRHKKAENKLEELSINVDVPDREKPYSPKITIKPIKVPDEEVSTTSNSETEVAKGSLKMTITKQSDKLHSVLKVCDSENPESTTDVEEPIPKLIIKPKVQQTEQQHSPKMSTRSSNQRSLSPRVTIKPVVKLDKQEGVSPLKIKIGLKSEETPKKHSSKSNSRSASKQEEDTPRKVLIKPIVKPVEDTEPVTSPRITIKPIPKPEAEKEVISRVNIKPVRKQDEENEEKERSSPKITIKPVVKPQEADPHLEEAEEVKERIVLKINKGNLPSPTKDSKKREHPPDDEKSEKLAKITVKFSKGGGHAHIVQQLEETHKRPHEDQTAPEKNKKQKVENESTMSTRSSRHKEVAVEIALEAKSRHKEHADGSDMKLKQKDIENPQFEAIRSSKHKDLSQDSPTEPKRLKLSEFPVRASRCSSKSRQREIETTEEIQIIETKLNSPIVISEDSRSQDSGSVILIDESKEEPSFNLTLQKLGTDSPKGTPKSDSVMTTPSTTPTPKKRGRPRKVPIEVREEFKEQEDSAFKIKSKQEGEEEGSLQQPAIESGRPKRSCRGPSVCDRLGIKPRKPRGPGRGRGGKRGMGTRPVPMKPEKVPKLTKAKLKLLQKAAQDEAEARKAFGKNPPGYTLGSTEDVIIIESEDVGAPETKKKPKLNLDSSDTEEAKSSTSETKKKIKSKFVEDKGILLSCSGPHTSESYPQKVIESSNETDIEREQNPSLVVNEGHSIVESSIKDDKKVSENVVFISEQVPLELKKELLNENISVEVKSELITAGEISDCVVDNNISSEEVSFKDIDIEANLCKNTEDVAIDVEDEIPYSILAPPGSTSSKVFPGLAQGMPATVQPLLTTSQKSSNPEHSSVSSTSGPSEVMMVDEETRMSAETSSRAQTPAKQMVAPADVIIDESQSSVHSTATTESGKTPSSRPSKAPRLEVQETDNNVITAELLSEYYWNGNGPFMIQEQVAQFLGIKSFKRKYPGIARRMVEMQERDFIREKGLASENMCDLGLTVVNSADILDIMYSDFQEKYEEYCKHQRDRQAKEMIDKQRAMNLAASQEKNKADITEQAVQSAAQWNAKFNKSRKDQRKTCMDLQTLTVHYPKGRIKQISKGTTGNYPVALVPGQFTDFYEEFSPTEINNLPLNTMCYDPVTFIPREESEDSGSEGSESDSDSSDSSSSGSNSDSSSGVEDCKLCKHSPKRVAPPK
ncbi:PHD finger protein enhancer of yellow 3 [Leptinotarsa decemlineata]|uniref:PHD finger protein enhancer of yellow 3 n=1 Tax=Leptinotarsa decemlineata TaxID=7539 RepID=UPI003D3046E6